jgi:hypothetical protein
MAPEELERGALIDERTTVFAMGRAAFVFLGEAGAFGDRPRSSLPRALRVSPIRSGGSRRSAPFAMRGSPIGEPALRGSRLRDEVAGGSLRE